MPPDLYFQPVAPHPLRITPRTRPVALLYGRAPANGYLATAQVTAPIPMKTITRFSYVDDIAVTGHQIAGRCSVGINGQVRVES